MVARGKQKMIEGTEEEIPEDLADKVAEYVKTLRLRMKKQGEEEVLRAEVIELMTEHKIDRVTLSDEDKFLVLEHGNDKLKIKKREAVEAE